MTNQASEDEQKVGYIKVTLNYAPKTNGKKFKEWCKDGGFTFIGGGRRAWSSSLSTYLRDADGIAYADGEPFLFYEEDLIDTQALIRTEKLKLLDEVRERVVGNIVCTCGCNFGDGCLCLDKSELRTEQYELLNKLEAEL